MSLTFVVQSNLVEHFLGEGPPPLTPLLLDSNIFWRLAITCSGPESLTPQLHIYQLELYPLPNVSLPILLRALYVPANVFLARLVLYYYQPISLFCRYVPNKYHYMQMSGRVCLVRKMASLIDVAPWRV